MPAGSPLPFLNDPALTPMTRAMRPSWGSEHPRVRLHARLFSKLMETVLRGGDITAGARAGPLVGNWLGLMLVLTKATYTAGGMNVSWGWVSAV